MSKMLAEAYRKALEFYDKATAPINATSEKDKTGLGGQIGKNSSKTEAQRALDDMEKTPEQLEAEAKEDAKTELEGKGKVRAK